MSDNKKYYYLKLKDNFFDSEDIKVLESMDNGYKYSNILLKMYLRSLKREGLLIFKERIPYNPKMIATVTGHNVNDVKQALVLFQEMGLIEMLSNGAIYMMDIQNYIGASSTEADRIRAYRNEIKQKKDKLLSGENIELLDASTNVQDNSYKCTPEIEIELELELERKKELKKEQEIDTYTSDFEELWEMYPLKKGKGRIAGKESKLKLISNMKDEMKRCIERYIKYVEMRKSTDFPEMHFMNGSTFFNGGYLDYTDENHNPADYEKPKQRRDEEGNYLKPDGTIDLSKGRRLPGLIEG